MGYNTGTWSAMRLVAVTTSDTVNLAPGCRGLYVGVGGDVAVVDSEGTAQTLKSVATSQVLPIQAKRVNATNTTATNIIALY